MIEYPYRVLEADGRTYPLVRVELEMKRRGVALPFLCLVDSGANVSLFSSDVADLLGLDLKSGPEKKLWGIGGEVTVYLHRVGCSLLHPTRSEEHTSELQSHS